MSADRILRFITDTPKDLNDLNRRFMEIPKPVKVAAYILEAYLLWRCAPINNNGNVPLPENTPDPNSTLIVPTDFPIPNPTATEVVGFGKYEFLTEEYITTNLSGLYEKFETDQSVKDILNNAEDSKLSAYGIKVFDLKGGFMIYPFFRAESVSQNKDFTFMILSGDQPGLVGYSLLERTVDQNGYVGLARTSDPFTNQKLATPQMVFNTGLTETELATISKEDFANRQILFELAKIEIPANKVVGKVQAITVKIDALVESQLPAEIGAEYIAEAEKSGYAHEVLPNGDVKMNFNDGKGLVLAFVKKAEGGYEVQKFKITREPVSAEGMFCGDLEHRDLKKDADCVQQQIEDSRMFWITFIAGDVYEEQRQDLNGQTQTVRYIEAHTRRLPGSPEIVIKIALEVDIGGRGPSPLSPDIFAAADRFVAGNKYTFPFVKTAFSEAKGIPYYQSLSEQATEYNNFYLGNDYNIQIFYPTGSANKKSMY